MDNWVGDGHAPPRRGTASRYVLAAPMTDRACCATFRAPSGARLRPPPTGPWHGGDPQGDAAEPGNPRRPQQTPIVRVLLRAEEDMAQQKSPQSSSNLDLMKRHLAEAEQSYGPDALATRMLRAEIARWERALQDGPTTLAEHLAIGPASTIGRRR